MDSNSLDSLFDVLNEEGDSQELLSDQEEIETDSVPDIEFFEDYLEDLISSAELLREETAEEIDYTELIESVLSNQETIIYNQELLFESVSAYREDFSSLFTFVSIIALFIILNFVKSFTLKFRKES